jgi:NADPH:quinone reductase-like Zn-dependent oxidoreductase
VQMLAARGVVVLATGRPADEARLIRLGAKHVLDYTVSPVADQARTVVPEGVDAVIDLVAASAEDVPLTAIRRGGMVVSSLGAASDDVLGGLGLNGINLMAAPTQEVLGTLSDLVESGALVVDVETVLPFDRAEEGLATVAGGHARGKIVIRVGG